MAIEILKSYKYDFSEYKSYKEKLDFWFSLSSELILFEFILNKKGGYLLDISTGKRKMSHKEKMKIKNSLPKPNSSQDFKYFYDTFYKISKSEKWLDEINSLSQIYEDEWYKNYILRNLLISSDSNFNLQILMLEDELKLIDDLTRLKIGREDSLLNKVFRDYTLDANYEIILLKYQERVFDSFTEIYNGFELAKYKIALEKKLIELRTKKKSTTLTQKNKPDFRSLFESEGYFTRMLNALVLDGHVKLHKNNYYSWELGYPAMGVLGSILLKHFKDDYKRIKNQDLARSMSAFFRIEYNGSVNKAFQPKIVKWNEDDYKEFEKIKMLSH